MAFRLFFTFCLTRFRGGNFEMIFCFRWWNVMLADRMLWKTSWNKWNRNVYAIQHLCYIMYNPLEIYIWIFHTYATSSLACSIAVNIMGFSCWMGLGIWTGIDICITPASIVPVVAVTTVELAFRSFTPQVTFTSTRASCGYNICNKFGVVLQTFRWTKPSK